jgi:hypothetical protein
MMNDHEILKLKLLGYSDHVIKQLGIMHIVEYEISPDFIAFKTSKQNIYTINNFFLKYMLHDGSWESHHVIDSIIHRQSSIERIMGYKMYIAADNEPLSNFIQP